MLIISNNQPKSIWNFGLFRFKATEVGLNMSFPAVLGAMFIDLYQKDPILENVLKIIFSYLLAYFIFELIYLGLFKFLRVNAAESIELTSVGVVYRWKQNIPQLIRPVFLYAIFLDLLLILVGKKLLVDSSIIPLEIYEYFQFFNLCFLFLNVIPCYPTKLYFLLESNLVKRKLFTSLYKFNELGLYLSMILSVFVLRFDLIFLQLTALTLIVFSYQRARRNKLRMQFEKYQLLDVLIPKERMITFAGLLPSNRAALIAVNSFQDFFPVLQEQKLIGLVSKSELIRNVALSENEYLRGLVQPSEYVISENQLLEQVAEIFQSTNLQVLPVVSIEGAFIGLIDREQVAEYHLLKTLEDHKQNSIDLE